jgi:hypothetical protein
MTNTPLAATIQLADILARENAALDAMDLSGAVALLPAKRSVLELLRTTDATNVQGDQRPAMEAALNRLRTLAGENRCLLERALNTQSRVIALIASALPQREANSRYPRANQRSAAARPAAWSLVARA